MIVQECRQQQRAVNVEAVSSSQGSTVFGGEEGPPGRRLARLLLSETARPLRFGLTGGSAGLSQLALLALLIDHGWHGIPANIVAFFAAAQLNFLLSTLFTWHDRRLSGSLRRRWLAFHTAIAGMAVLNMLVFIAVRSMLPDLTASAAGILAAALGNFLIGDRLVFRTHRSVASITGASRQEPAA